MNTHKHLVSIVTTNRHHDTYSFEILVVVVVVVVIIMSRELSHNQLNGTIPSSIDSLVNRNLYKLYGKCQANSLSLSLS